MQCAHLYLVDPATGQILSEVGNTQMPFLSDIDFSPDGTLYGNQWDGLGTLVTVDTMTGTGSATGPFGLKLDSTGLVKDIQNGGLSVDPATGDIWAVESGSGRR